MGVVARERVGGQGDLAQQNGPTVAELRDESAELMAGVSALIDFAIAGQTLTPHSGRANIFIG